MAQDKQLSRRGIYITSTEPRSGKSFIVLGLMEFLAGRTKKLGFFRPVVREGHQQDSLIALVARRYGLEWPEQSMYGCTYEEARTLMAADNRKELYSRIIEKYKSLEAQCDFVVCVGTDYTGVSAVLEFDFNVDVAGNLGLPILPVLSAAGRDARSAIDTAQVFFNTLREKHSEVLALIISRVSPAECEAVAVGVRQVLGDVDCPIDVLPEEVGLDQPTVREIALALEAQILSGSDELLYAEVNNIKVAAMELPHFLEHIEEGSLIITPGDRSDIILGTVAAEMSHTHPRIAGIVLTGGLKPPLQIQKILDGLGGKTIPVLSVSTDTFDTAIAVNAVEPVLAADDKRKIAAALGLIESSVDVPGLLGRTFESRSERMTPLMFQYELVQRAKRARKNIVLPEGTEERILRAAEIVLLRKICDITLLGDQAEIRRKIDGLGLALDAVNIIDPASSELRAPFAEKYFEYRKHKGISQQMAYDGLADASYFGTMMAHLGYADGMVSGAIHTTAHTIRPALEFVKCPPGISIVSSVFFMCLADQVLVYGDCAVNPDPNAQQLADIAICSAQTALNFGIEPRIAMLSYSTGDSGTGPEVDKVREATRIVRASHPELKIEGPIQYDAAIDSSVAKVKLPGSEVAGHATVFIFPDLNAGNNAYKAVQRAADAVAIGPILQGLNKPVNDLSRGALVPDIVNTIAITAIQAQNQQTKPADKT